MSDRNWPKRIAYGLGVLAAVLLVIFSYNQYILAKAEQTLIEARAEDQAAQQDGRTQERINASCSELVSAQSIECQRETTDNAESRKREIRDLEAQQSMALWTRYMGVAAIIGITVSIIGVGLVFTTFQQTRRAADSATDTHKAFVAAERGMLQFYSVRAHNAEHGRATIHIRLKNLGKSACILEEMHIAVVRPTAIWPKQFESCLGNPGFAISATELRDGDAHSSPFPVPSSDLFYVVGYIDYRTLVKAQFRTHFCVRITGHGSGEDAFGQSAIKAEKAACAKMPNDT